MTNKLLRSVAEDLVEIGSAKDGLGLETRDRVRVALRVVHDRAHLICAECAREVQIDRQKAAFALEFSEQVNEPLEAVRVTIDPVERDGLDGASRVHVLNAVLDGLENGGEGRDTNTSGPERDIFELERFFRGRTEGSVDENDGSAVGGRQHVLLHEAHLVLGIEQAVQATGPISDNLR